MSGLYVPRPTYRTAGGLLVPRPLTKRERYGDAIVGLDVFAGCGGFSLGVKQSGIHVVGMVEYDEAATITYMTNLCRYGQVQMVWGTPEDAQRMERYMVKTSPKMRDAVARINRGERLTPEELKGLWRTGSGWIAQQPPEQPATDVVFFGDVRQFSGARILDALGLARGEIDVVFGGPPCQGFSTAGRRNVMDPRNSLVFEFARLITALNPSYFVMENVPGLISMKTPEGVPVLDQFSQMVADGGWGTYEAVKTALGAAPGARMAVRGRRATDPAPTPETATKGQQRAARAAHAGKKPRPRPVDTQPTLFGDDPE